MQKKHIKPLAVEMQLGSYRIMCYVRWDQQQFNNNNNKEIS